MKRGFSGSGPPGSKEQLAPPPRRTTAVALSIGLMALIGVVDHFTGYELGFFVFYFVPVSLAVWFSGRIAGTAVSLLSALTWLAVDSSSGHAYTAPWYAAWNVGIRLVAFLLISFALDWVRAALTREKELSTRLRSTLDQVKELAGLLPICASCKKIRNDAGYWEQIEGYIARHSKAEFSHGICPECARKLYPGLHPPP